MHGSRNGKYPATIRLHHFQTIYLEWFTPAPAGHSFVDRALGHNGAIPHSLNAVNVTHGVNPALVGHEHRRHPPAQPNAGAKGHSLANERAEIPLGSSCPSLLLWSATENHVGRPAWTTNRCKIFQSDRVSSKIRPENGQTRLLLDISAN